MKILFLRNPLFATSPSMERFADMVVKGFAGRGHQAKSVTANGLLAGLSRQPLFKKWLGYCDKFILFRRRLLSIRATLSPDTLVVALDQALGPWMPVFKAQPRAVHVHDLVSIRAASGEFPHMSTSATGKIYNRYILSGLRTCTNFVCVSGATRNDLRRLVGQTACNSKVVYNGLGDSFVLGNCEDARLRLSKHMQLSLQHGYLLHVGADVWYKNRIGVVRLYDAWRRKSGRILPLLMAGPPPAGALARCISESAFASDIHSLPPINDDLLANAYHGASTLLFPSLVEGFGWPIAEAIACGCPVVTTQVPPMTEVGMEFAYYLPLMPSSKVASVAWAKDAVGLVECAVVSRQKDAQRLQQGSEKAIRTFARNEALDHLERFYEEALMNSVSK